MSDKAERLRALNDQLRTTFVGGAVMITQGVEAIPIPRRKLILAHRRESIGGEACRRHGKQCWGSWL